MAEVSEPNVAVVRGLVIMERDRTLAEIRRCETLVADARVEVEKLELRAAMQIERLGELNRWLEANPDETAA